MRTALSVTFGATSPKVRGSFGRIVIRPYTLSVAVRQLCHFGSLILFCIHSAFCISLPFDKDSLSATYITTR